MDFRTVDQWDEKVWKNVCFIYEQAFGNKGAKPEKIIRHMFQKGICYLHIGSKNGEVISMAITGKLNGINALLIDYLAVRQEMRGKGLGQEMIQYIKEWCLSASHFNSLIIEVESDISSENLARVHFWGKCGFHLTEYIHHYIWVPEPYQAMYLKLRDEVVVPETGEELFKYIGHFHKTSFRGA
ncbi:GNAT family N-acetyltransferase [Bacillus sp. BRMEA1]|uniref:GNAT family N-acetyltransferase n=1 Tax=Neobacillus endophyticus TaxID=2738405 RepID=UPI0015649E96|nr:GNAT family N-acetyltransferase [Neobacillus endophyticus]NRD79526.1 GNAT family N-acetyltransferase [Neobacillus endophyticus]